MTGHPAVSFIHEAGYAAIRAVDGAGIPFIKPWEDREFEEKLAKALDTGTDAVAGAHGRNFEELIYRVTEGGQDPMDAIVSATSRAGVSPRNA